MSLKHHRWLLIASVLVLLCFLIAVFLFLRKPVLTHVSPQQAFPGSSVTIRGYFFGLQEPGSTLRVGNQHITKSHILLWESSRIEFRMPDEMRSGDIVVTRNQRESNGMLLTNINTIPRPLAHNTSPSLQAELVEDRTPPQHSLREYHFNDILTMHNGNNTIVYDNTSGQALYTHRVELKNPESAAYDEVLLKIPLPDVPERSFKIESTFPGWVQLLPFTDNYAFIRLFPHNQLRGTVNLTVYGNITELHQSTGSSHLPPEGISIAEVSEDVEDVGGAGVLDDILPPETPRPHISGLSDEESRNIIQSQLIPIGNF